MKRAGIIALFILSVVSFRAAHAATPPQPSVSADAALRVLSIMAQTATAQNDLHTLEDISIDDLAQKIQGETRRYFDAFLKGPNPLSMAEQQLLTKTFDTPKGSFWKSIAEKMKKNFKGIKSTFRLQGLAAVIAYGAGIAFEVMLNVFLIHIGKAEIVPIVTAMPISSIFSGAQMLTDRYFIRQKAKKLFESPLEYQAFEDSRAAIRKAFALKPSDGILHLIPTSNAIVTAAIVEPGFLNKKLQQLGLKSKSLTFSNLQEFCKKQDIYLEFIAGLKQEPISEIQRTIFLLDAIVQNESAQVRTEFLGQFHKSFKLLHTDMPQSATIVTWVTQILELKTGAEILQAMHGVPSGMDSETLAAIWRQIFFPKLTESDLPASTLRKVYRRFQTELEPQLKAGATTASTEQQAQWVHQFLKPVKIPSECSLKFESIIGEEFLGSF